MFLHDSRARGLTSRLPFDASSGLLLLSSSRGSCLFPRTCTQLSTISNAPRRPATAAMAAPYDDDEEYDIPLLDQRYFGSGLKRKRVQFVPASEQTNHSASLSKTPRSFVVPEGYQVTALSKSNTAERASSAPAPDQPAQGGRSDAKGPEGPVSATDQAGHASDTENSKPYCNLCRRPLSSSESMAEHLGSIVHQINIPHSHPPSHVDRNRKGLAVLQAQGWDPDSRLGLGATGEGILQPIRAFQKPDNAGVGAKLAPAAEKPKPVKLGPKAIRKMEEEAKKKKEQLAKMFYSNNDEEKYLGNAGGKNDLDTLLDMKAFAEPKTKKR